MFLETECRTNLPLQTIATGTIAPAVNCPCGHFPLQNLFTWTFPPEFLKSLKMVFILIGNIFICFNLYIYSIFLIILKNFNNITHFFFLEITSVSLTTRQHIYSCYAYDLPENKINVFHTIAFYFSLILQSGKLNI